MKIKFQPIKSDNVDLFIETFNKSLAKYEGEYEINKYDIVCTNLEIYVDDVFVGFIGYQLWEFKEPIYRVNQYICNFIIFEEFRNKGYGSAVIKEMVKRGKNKYGTIYCMVSTSNLRAIEFYSRIGMFVSSDARYINHIVPGYMRIVDNSYLVVFYDKNNV